MIKERREYRRWDSKLSCMCFGDGFTLKGEITNLSFNGACVSNPSQLPPAGSDLEVTVRPGNENVTLKAQVVFVEGPAENRPAKKCRFGIQFLVDSKEKFQKLMPYFEESIQNEE